MTSGSVSWNLAGYLICVRRRQCTPSAQDTSGDHERGPRAEDGEKPLNDHLALGLEHVVVIED